MNQSAMAPLREFCARHGVQEPIAERRIRAGRNNEVSHLSTSEGQWILKRFYQHPSHPRRRLGVEFAFLTFLADAGVHCVPRPLAKDLALGCALYSFVPG